MSDFVFSRIYDDTAKATRNINNYFEKFEIYNSNLYQILNQIPQYNIVQYLFIAAIIYFIFSFYNIEIKHLFILFISILIIGYLIQKDFGDFNQYISFKKDQLRFINKLCFDGEYFQNFGPKDEMNIFPQIKKSYLYRNPLIVEFYYNLREFTQFNLSAYVSSVLHTNNVMALHNQIKTGLMNPFANVDVMKNEMNESLNALQSMIYKVPESQISMDKLKNSCDALQSMLLFYIVEVEEICQKRNKNVGLNYLSKPDDQLNTQFEIAPNDIKTREYNPTYNLY